MSEESKISIVRVRCRWCGPVRVQPGRVRILLAPTGPKYAFTCACGRPTANDASPRALAALRLLHCVEQPIELPPRTLSDAPPITADELLDMHLALLTPEWEHELFA